jgi:type II secretory pathway pseudopilin PulG
VRVKHNFGVSMRALAAPRFRAPAVTRVNACGYELLICWPCACSSLGWQREHVTTMRQTRTYGAGGFSLIETTIVLSVLTLLTSVMAPSIGDYVAGARLVKARSDMEVISVAIARFAFDVTLQPNRPGSWSRFDVLVGAGAIPAASTSDAEAWLADVSSERAGALDDHLVTNQAGHARRPQQVGGGMFWRGWAGPYLGSGVGPDPWGYRYAVSVGHLTDGSGSNTIVISAGPNGVVDTPFHGRGVRTDFDDLSVLLAPGR